MSSSHQLPVAIGRRGSAAPAAAFALLLALPAAAQLQLPGSSQPTTRIEINGLQSMSKAEAFEVLGERLAFARSKPPTPALADDVAFMLRLLLENHGFQDPQVDSTISGRTIVLTVDEGRRLWLGSVFVKGAPEEDARRLSLLFSSTGEKRRSQGDQQTPFRESDVGAGLELIRTDFKSRGYWNADVSVEKRSIDPATGEVKFVIATEPGPLHTIGSARFDGDLQGLDKLLAATALTFDGQPATTTAINQLRASVEKSYRSRGYENASVRMTLEPAGSRLVPSFTLDPGTRFRVGGLEVAGLERTRRQSLMRFTGGLEQGDIYDAEDVNRRLDGLLATGAFASAQLETRERGEFLDLALKLEEGKARGTSFYGGFGTYEGPILGARYYDRNFSGRLWNLTGGIELSGRTILGEAGLTIPWIDGAGSSLGFRVFALGRDHEGYSKFETGVSSQYSRMLAENAPLTLFAAASYVDVSSDGIPPPYLGETSYAHLRVRATQEYDRRNDPMLPTKGWNVFGSVELGSANGNENVGYLAIEAGGSWHTPVGDENHLSLGLRAGSILSAGDELPIDLRYFLGGPDSVRSFEEREMPPRTKYNYPRGGKSYWVFNAEYVHQVAGPLKAVVFTDAGGLSTNSSDFGFDDTNVAAGLGLRLDLPIGPVRFEYGHNLTRDLGEPSGAFHLAIGIAF